MFVAVDGAVAGLVAVADPVKPTTAAALAALHELGFRIVMATGDNARTARAVAARLGIDEVRAEVLPEDKAAARARAAGGRAPGGDGRRRDQRCAGAGAGRRRHRHGHRRGRGDRERRHHPGQGRLAGIVRARRLALATMRNIRQNLFFAFVYNAAGVPVAAGVLYPFLGHADLADVRRRGDEPVVGLGDRERAAAALGAARRLIPTAV